MQVTKTFEGREVQFTTRINDTRGTGLGGARVYCPKTIDFRIVGGGAGVAFNWIEALATAREFAAIANEDDARRARTAAAEDAARAARIAKHEAKMKRRAAAQSLKARLQNICAEARS